MLSYSLQDLCKLRHKVQSGHLPTCELVYPAVFKLIRNRPSQMGHLLGSGRKAKERLPNLMIGNANLPRIGSPSIHEPYNLVGLYRNWLTGSDP